MSLENSLENKRIKSPIPVFKKQLNEISNFGLITQLFSKVKLNKGVAFFGLEILNLDDHYHSEHIEYGSQKLAFFDRHIEMNMWEKKKYYNLLLYFFGSENAKYVKAAWLKLPLQMYQEGYERRSFRAPYNKKFLLVNQINFLRSIIDSPRLIDYQNDKYYNLTFQEQIRYDNVIMNNHNQFMLWSAALDSGNTSLYKLMEDIIFNKDPIGKVSRGIVKALLNSDKKECWELVEKLLLSAQRQEGLRQTILESLDETSIGALKYMINVIVENKLARFSSVVRAVDTWTGLGWDAEKETTVRNILTLAQSYFAAPDSIKIGIQSKNNTEAYMALWTQGVLNVQKTTPFLHELLEKGSIEKKCLALKFAGETNDPSIEMPLYYKALEEDNLQVLAFALPRLQRLLEANSKSQFYIDNPEYPDFFNKIHQLSQKITVKKKAFEGKVFSWLNTRFERELLLTSAIHLIGNNNEKLKTILDQFEELPISVRETLAQEVLGNFYCYSYYSLKDKSSKKSPTDFQKRFAVKLLKDRGESLVASAIYTLKNVALSEVDLESFHELFKRKNSNLKKHLTVILLDQKDSKIGTFVEKLIETGGIDQRVSALDIMYQLQTKNRLLSKIKKWTNDYSERPKLSEKENKFLAKLTPTKKEEILTPENGFGFFDPKNISPYKLPKNESDSIYSRLNEKHQYGFTQPYKKLKSELAKLQSLYLENRNYEYDVETWDNSKETVLLGNQFSRIAMPSETWTKEQLFQNYPLHEVWQQWMEESNLAPSDLFLFIFEQNCDNKFWRSELADYVFYYEGFIPNPTKENFYWNNPIIAIIECLQLKYSFEEKNSFLADACGNLYSNLPRSVLNYKYIPKRNEYHSNRDGNGWQSQHVFDVYLKAITKFENISDSYKAKIWNLYRWRQFSGLKANAQFSLPPLHLYCEAFKQGLISQEEIYEGILNQDRLRTITDPKSRIEHYAGTTEFLVEKYDFLQPIIDEVRDTFLDIELKRGDSNTSVSHFVTSFQKIYGIQRFVELLQALGKGNLHKGYIYYWSDDEISRQKLFSTLLKRCFPRKNETQKDFEEALKACKFTEKRLIQAAIYAPQWQVFISDYLGWDGLDEGIWWLHAHTKTAAYSDVNSELESEVAKYSAVDLQDFKDGAVDKDWFLSSYKKLGKAKWEMLYDSAKYIADGNGHRRARLYSDTLTGHLKIREVTAKVKDKRDQDYLRVYGLVPLSKANPEKDVLSRYEYILQFKKESREFGSMRQTSEGLAIRVAMENLARNAGYPDPIRLTWAMETKQVQKILSKETQVTIGNATVSLVIDTDGKAQLITEKEGKKLKSIPTKLKKEPAILELGKHRKVLRAQWTRSKKGLEEAMIRGDEFLLSEMLNLFDHPVICKHLEKLIFISNDDQIGFFSGGKLTSSSGETIPTNDNTSFLIAHCYDLHKHNVWTDLQRYCFDNKLKQPFKQIFRELYVPTPDELKEKSISRRYAGHQVHPKQTLALLKSRGWKVDYEEGLQKGYHKEGFQVKLYAMADWFSPADVESPTLETVQFLSLKDFKNIPFEDINPRTFSEVMRDIDLVVSVAHVGGTDPETSHSSIEMRTVLLRETLRLFKITNVEIEKNHAMIKGELAEYSLHLGSAVVHQLPGKYLSILPVHSQHRGRLFLPFADDDPKSAEVMSKVLLLAKDSDIQDPTILRQINQR